MQDKQKATVEFKVGSKPAMATFLSSAFLRASEAVCPPSVPRRHLDLARRPGLEAHQPPGAIHVHQHRAVRHRVHGACIRKPLLVSTAITGTFMDLGLLMQASQATAKPDMACRCTQVLAPEPKLCKGRACLTPCMPAERGGRSSRRSAVRAGCTGVMAGCMTVSSASSSELSDLPHIQRPSASGTPKPASAAHGNLESK